jgi:hypothetical protein
MALFHSLLGDVLTVREEVFSYGGSKVTFVRYNVKTWQVQVNNDPWRPMTPEAIAWCKTHHLPKVQAA